MKWEFAGSLRRRIPSTHLHVQYADAKEHFTCSCHVSCNNGMNANVCAFGEVIRNCAIIWNGTVLLHWCHLHHNHDFGRVDFDLFLNNLERLVFGSLIKLASEQMSGKDVLLLMIPGEHKYPVISLHWSHLLILIERNKLTSQIVEQLHLNVSDNNETKTYSTLLLKCVQASANWLFYFVFQKSSNLR